MIDAHYYMTCSCILLKNQLVLHNKILSCNNHLQQIDYVKQPCARCGKFLKSYSWKTNVVFCNSCNKLLAQAKTICTYHNLPVFIDPILLRKSLAEIAEDIGVNLLFKKEVIQIDTPRRVQHEQKPIRIDIEQKLKFLKEDIACQHSQASH